ncbi:MAG: TlpA family protein disulfide reductase [Odoribacteraceae bacterium]|jgi:peroxiredoxin|nr:TlpA family protein disulfide reductase [Odoribacteraceae bacterium]
MKNAWTVIAMFLFFSGSTRGQDRGLLVKVGDKMPDFEVQLFNGERLATKDLRGKVLLLNFWATWNPPSLEEFKRVPDEIVKRFEGKDFVYLAISREDPREQVEAFRERTGYRFTMGLDTGREIYSRFATTAIPRDFVINKEGRIVYTTNGYSEKGFSEMIRVVEKLLE